MLSACKHAISACPRIGAVCALYRAVRLHSLSICNYRSFRATGAQKGSESSYGLKLPGQCSSSKWSPKHQWRSQVNVEGSKTCNDDSWQLLLIHSPLNYICRSQYRAET